jgi:hypothetical protein
VQGVVTVRLYVDDGAINGLVNKLSRLGAEAGQTAVEMAEAAGNYAVEALKMATHDYGHHRTGGLEGSIGLKGKPQMTANGASVVVTFKGTNEHGERYGAIAAYLNYGTGNKGADGGIKPSHWVDNTREDIKGAVVEIAEKVLDSKLKGK